MLRSFVLSQHGRCGCFRDTRVRKVGAGSAGDKRHRFLRSRFLPLFFFPRGQSRPLVCVPIHVAIFIQTQKYADMLGVGLVFSAGFLSCSRRKNAKERLLELAGLCYVHFNSTLFIVLVFLDIFCAFI